MSDRVLVFGDDGSRGADVAWLWVNSHRWPGWRVDVITGQEPSTSTEWGATPEPQEWTPPWGRTYFDPEELAGIRSLHVDEDPRLVLGARDDADLVVVGERGLGPARAAWSGSTTEWLLHHPPAPLAIIRSGATVREVLCCVDGSEHARGAIEAFAALPLAATAHATVLVVDDGRVADDVAAPVLEHLRAAGVDATEARAEGKPTRVIHSQIDTLRPELVVLGTRGLTGWRRLRVGSTAGAVVHHASVSCLVACVDAESG